MPTYLLEIGTEELPSGYVSEAQNQLKENFDAALKAAHLSFDSLVSMGTPRRIAILVRGLAEKQETSSKKIKGPPVSGSFDADGVPNSKALGFAAKHNLSVSDLSREEQNGVEYLTATIVSPGKSTTQILSDSVGNLVARLPGDRLMRWGSSEFKFSRPIRWLVSLLDREVVPLTINDVRAGRQSFGHRILHKDAIDIEHAENYVETLEKAFVLVDPQQRRQLIESEVQACAKALGGQPKQLDGALVEEVVNITEWPRAVTGTFAQEFLALPGTLIETVMVHHQRYFPVEKTNGAGSVAYDTSFRANRLLPNFITIANNDREEAREEIRKGNERVLRARLADGRFFYFDDQKQKLGERRNALCQLTFQEGLGSYEDKVLRMLRVAANLGEGWGLEAAQKVPLERTLELCKNDLVTNLVRELPELQGYVGAWYAEHEGQPPEVVRAIASHYSPRSTADSIPSDTVGRLTAVIDKADTSTGLFCLGRRPTGSSDPYALRRQAQGLVDVLMQGLSSVPIHLSDLIRCLISEYEPVVEKQKNYAGQAKTFADLHEFLLARVKTNLAAIADRREIVDAVVGARPELSYLPDLALRCRRLNQLIKSEEGIELIRAGARIANILAAGSEGTIDKSILTEVAEKELLARLESTFGDIDSDSSQEDQRSVERRGGGRSEAERRAEERRRSDGAITKNSITKNSLTNNPLTSEPPNPRPSIEHYDDVLSKLASMVPWINLFFDSVMVNDEDERKRANRHALLNSVHRHFKFLADFSKLLPLAN